MQKNSTANTRNGVLLSLLILGVIAALAILPYQFRSEAGSKGKGNSLNPRTESHEEGLENYDIREVKSDETADSLMKFRQSVGKDASAVVTTREDFVRGENELRTKVPTLKIEYNNDIRIPEVITPDVWKNEPSYLTGPSNLKRAEILRSFVKENNSLIGVDDAQAEGLKVTADYTNPDGNLSFAHLEQRINNIPVFRGEVKAGFTKDGKMIRVINNLAPGLDYESLSTDFRNPLDAVKSAARSINYELKSVDVTPNAAASNDLKTVFGNGDWATTAEKMYFPTEPGVAVPSWRVLIWQPVNAYYIIVDAETGTMLWRKNVTEDQTQSATYQVYTNPNAMIDVADSPAPLSPSPADPTVGTQAPVIARTTRTLIGNEAPYTFNNNGWITDGANVTDGNALEAGIDRDGTNGVDLPLQTGTPNRVFNSTWNPAPGNPAPGDDPLTAQAQRGAVIQMFYVMNRYHDEMYRLGFTEQAFNFQGDNFGRGGVGGDRISGEGQDSSGTNNANFATVADGGRGRMQMFVWTGPTPDYDGTGDAEVIIHEVTHGTSNRLHGNASGLSTNMARGMGEGWSDFYAHAMLSEPTDPANGIYALGGYATYLISAGFTGNYYYGIRRYPKAPIGFLGPNGKPHNAYTFSYINADCNTRLGTANFAFARGPIGVTQCDQVHNIGEIWSSALWEVRTLMVSRLGWSVGNRKALQLVTDGMKLAPIGPTLLQERDAIIAAAQASAVSPEAAADVVDVREGFRRRGMGFSASVTVQSPAAVVEAFDFPNVQTVNPFSVSDSTGDNDGFPEPGESILLSVAVTNSTGATVTNVTANVTGGGSANYGDIANGVTVTRQIPYTVPTGAICGSLHQVTVNVSSSVGAQSPVVREFRLGAPVGGAPVTFTNNTALTIPDSGVSAPYGTTIAVSGLSGSKLITLEITGNTHTFPGDLDYLLVGPGGQKFSLLSDSGSTGDTTNLTFTLSDSATAQPSTTQWAAGNFKPVNIGAGDPFAAPAPAAPYLEAPAAGSASFASVFGTDGAAMNGTWTLYVVDDAAGDFGSQAGWKLTFGGNDYTCTLAPTVKSRADFDGDGKTDLSVFRPSNNTWYLQKSTDGFSAATFGATGDTATPRDWDGDGKADVAVHRPVATDGVADFFILKSSDNTLMTHVWGTTNDVNVSADYDGDGKSDPAIFRPSTNTWWVFQTSNTTGVPTTFGASGDVPVTGDFDGDGKADLTVFRNGQWITRKSSDNSVSFTSFGLATDKLVPADYDGDNKDDIAVWRPSNGVWYILRSTNGAVDFIQFGANGDVAVPGDYDGDGKDDQAVYRGGTWFLNRSTAGFSASPFGLATDVPAPSKYIP